MYQVSEIKLKRESTIREALEVIDRGAMKIALVTDEHDRLLGTLSDGDIRRGLLRGLQLDDPIRDIFNQNPVTASLSDPKEKIIQLAVERKIYQIPVVDTAGKVVRLAEIDQLIRQEIHPNLVVLMAGGLGSRLRPLTGETPKPMLPVGGRPILESLVERFRSQGYTRFVISLNYLGDQIRRHFGDGNDRGVEISYIEENQPLGTAGALGMIHPKPKEPFLVMNGDILTLMNFESLMEFHHRNRSAATMCIREFGMEVPYGVVRLNKENIVSIEEKPVQQFYVNAGIYVLNPDALRWIQPGERLDMTRLFEIMVEKGYPTLSYPIREYWMDIGKIDDYERACREYPELFNGK